MTLSVTFGGWQENGSLAHSLALLPFGTEKADCNVTYADISPRTMRSGSQCKAGSPEQGQRGWR